MQPSYMHSNVQINAIYNSQDMEAAWMSINRWMDKKDAVHLYNRILLSLKKNEKYHLQQPGWTLKLS